MPWCLKLKVAFSYCLWVQWFDLGVGCYRFLRTWGDNRCRLYIFWESGEYVHSVHLVLKMTNDHLLHIFWEWPIKCSLLLPLEPAHFCALRAHFPSNRSKFLTSRFKWSSALGSTCCWSCDQRYQSRTPVTHQCWRSSALYEWWSIRSYKWRNSSSILRWLGLTWWEWAHNPDGSPSLLLSNTILPSRWLDWRSNGIPS